MENFYFDTTIDELYKEGHISIRAYHELENNGIFTLGDVNSRIIKNNRNLPIVKGMGRITSSLLLDILAKVDWKNQISPDKHCFWKTDWIIALRIRCFQEIMLYCILLQLVFHMIR